jgi:hypothetical protein
MGWEHVLHKQMSVGTVVSRCQLSGLACAKLGPRTARRHRAARQLEDGSHELASINLLSLCWPMRRGGADERDRES